MDNEQFHPRHHEWFSDYTAQEHGTPFRSWLAAAYPSEYAALRATEAKPSASAAPGIDTPEFRNLLGRVWHMPTIDGRDARAKALIAHIDAVIAAAREEEWKQHGLKFKREADALWTRVHAAEAEVRDLRGAIAAALEGETTLPYTEAIGAAGDRYYRTVAAFAHPLPAKWRWHELWDAMLAAAPQPQAK